MSIVCEVLGRWTMKCVVGFPKAVAEGGLTVVSGSVMTWTV